MRAANAVFHLLGVDRSSAFGGWLLRTLGPLSNYDKYARANLKLCLPDLSGKETDEIVREMWDNFGRTVGEFLLLEKLAVYGPEARVEIVGEEIIDRVLAEGKTIVFFSGHFANWELASPYIVQKTGRLAGVYRAANNPLVDQWIINTRSTMTFNTLLPKGRKGAKGTIECLRRGEHLAMLLDQKLNEGPDIPLFGQNAKTATAAALFAVKYGCPLVPVGLQRLEGAKFVVTFYEPLEIQLTGDQTQDVLTVATQYNKFIEDQIRANPGQWLWMHNRWTTPNRKRYTKRPRYKKPS